MGRRGNLAVGLGARVGSGEWGVWRVVSEMGYFMLDLMG